MTLNDIAYVLLPLAFVVILTLMVTYNRRVRLKARELRSKGVVMHSTQEEILLAERALSPASHPGVVPR
jgi:hypothetical protein